MRNQSASLLTCAMTRRQVKGVTATAVLALALATVGPTAHADSSTAGDPTPIAAVPVIGSSPAPVRLGAAHTVGTVVDTEGDVEIREVRDGSGNLVGYTFDEASRALHEGTTGDRLSAEQPGQHTTAANFWTCSAAVAWFIAQTVFPSVKIAKLAWRLGKLVRTYGPSTTVRVLTGARKLSNRTAQQEFRELALALTGVGGLQAGCNFRVL